MNILTTFSRLFFIACLFLSSNVLLAQWNKGVPLQTDNSDLTAISMANQNIGFTVTANGKIFKTTNGAITWNQVFQPDNSSFIYYEWTDVVAVSENVVVAVGRNFGPGDYLILRSVNGGSTWTPSTWEYDFPLDGTFTALDFPTENVGYAVGAFGVIHKTSDGGVSWQRINTPNNQHLSDVFFIDATNGYAIGEEQIWKTTNGGASWEIVGKGGKKLHFFSARVGFAADNQELRKTTNGGQSWTVLPYKENIQLSDVVFTDENTGYLASESKMYKTIDGGQQWLLQIIKWNNIEHPINDLDFINIDDGFAACRIANFNQEGSVVIATSNAGGFAANFALPDTVCAGSAATFIAKHTPAPTVNYEWSLNGIIVSTNDTAVITMPGNGGNQFISLKTSTPTDTITNFKFYFVQLAPQEAQLRIIANTTICARDIPYIYFTGADKAFDYELKINGNVVSDLLPGLNPYPVPLYFQLSALDTTTTYELWRKSDKCGESYTGKSITIQVNPLPKGDLPVVADKGVVCFQGTSVISILNSQLNTNYTLLKDSINTSFSLNGNGGIISFPSVDVISERSSVGFSVEALNEFGCRTILADTAQIRIEKPRAAFGFNALNVPVGQPVHIRNASEEAATYDWQFDENATPASSSVPNPPAIQYATAGIHNVQLNITSPAGCKDSIIQSVGTVNEAALSPYWALELPIGDYGHLFSNHIEVDQQGRVYFPSVEIFASFGDTSELIPSTAGASGKFQYGLSGWTRFSEKGVLEKAISMGGTSTVREVAAAPDGSVYAAVGFEEYLTFDRFARVYSNDGSYATIPKVPNWAHVAFVKYDEEGQIQWINQLKGMEYCLSGISIRDLNTDSAGNLLALINIANADNCRDSFVLVYANGIIDTLSIEEHALLKFSPTGDLLWMRLINEFMPLAGAPRMIPLSFVQDTAENIYLSGYGPSQIAKLDAAGNLLWETGPSSGSSLLYDLDIDNQGNVYAIGVGSFTIRWGDFTFENEPGFGRSNPSTLVVKIAPNGQIAWMKGADNGDGFMEGNSIDEYDGKLYFKTFFRDSFSYDGISFSNVGWQDVILFQVDAATGNYEGHIQWGQISGEGGGISSSGRNLYIDKNGIVYFAGQHAAPITFFGKEMNNNGWTHLVKSPWNELLTSIIEVVSGRSVYIFPNPVQNFFRLAGDENTRFPLQLQLFSIDGKLVWQKQATSFETQFTLPDHVTTGSYILRIQDQNQQVLGLKMIVK